MKPIAEIETRRSGRSTYRIAGLAVLAIVVAAGAIWKFAIPSTRAPSAPAPRVPVSVAAATARDVPIFIGALGTAQARYTVAVHSQIDGPLQSVDFNEGQEVRKGDTLAIIDPRPLQAALDQAIAKKAQDEAQLVAAEKDLNRFSTLGTRGFETQQNIDTQQAKVDQLKATVQADDAAIEAAQIQLGYTTIKAPIDGRVGFRQVDPGNIVHANDQNPLTVLTLTHPIDVVLTLPQESLGTVREAMLKGPVQVLAYDQGDVTKLADGELRLIDNEIDQTTGTIRLKATFANDDGRLWSGEFMHLRIHVETRTGAVTVAPPAVQRGPQGLYVWVVTPDGKAEQRAVATIAVDNSTTIVTSGLKAGERVVVNGQSRLQPGTQVEAKAASPEGSADGAS